MEFDKNYSYLYVESVLQGDRMPEVLAALHAIEKEIIATKLIRQVRISSTHGVEQENPAESVMIILEPNCKVAWEMYEKEHKERIELMFTDLSDKKLIKRRVAFLGLNC